MRLLIKQKVFSWRDKFAIKDENGNDRYYAEGEVFSWAKKLHIFDLSGREVAYIEQKVWSWMPKYYIFRNGSPVTLIQRDGTLKTQQPCNTLDNRRFARAIRAKQDGDLPLSHRKAYVIIGKRFAVPFCHMLNFQHK